MWVRVRLAGAYLAGACLATLLSACAVIDPVDKRYDIISRSLAKARNDSIFLNIVRASQSYPLSFVTISNVTPTVNNTTSLGLPTFLFGPPNPVSVVGPDVIFGSSVASNSTNIGSNFNVSSQETSAFYQGFLKPIDLQTLAYFIRQGYPRELLFWLFTDSFYLDRGGHKLGYHYAPPDDYGCNRNDPKQRCFVDWVEVATLAGLTVEEKTLLGSNPKSGGPSNLIYARFCFNSILSQEAKARMTPEEIARARHDIDVSPADLYASPLTCGSDAWSPIEAAAKPQPDILPLRFERSGITFSIVPRSAYGVFDFLGTLMRMRRLQIQAPGGRYYPPTQPYIPENRPYVLEPPTLSTVREDPDLLQILYKVGGDCFVHTWFNEVPYCVPEQAATTKRIFALLAQLIAIQTAAGDLSITPIVRVIQ